MKAAPYIKTPQLEEDEEILIQKEYVVKYNSDLIKIIIGKTKHNIIIRNTYYELKLSKDDLSLLTKIIYKSIDESFEFLKNIFEKNKYEIKEKSSKSIKLILRIYDMIKEKEKDIELILLENFENQNFLFKDLFDKYINIEKEIYDIKNDNKFLKEENGKLKQDNNNLKMEIEIIKNKNNNNNEIGGLQMQYMNIMNNINMIQTQINQLMNKINEIEQNKNMILNSNLNIMNQRNYSPMNNIYNGNNNLNPMDISRGMQNFNNMNMMANKNEDDDWMKGFRMGIEEVNKNNINSMNNINNNLNPINQNNYNLKNTESNNLSNNKKTFVIFRISGYEVGNFPPVVMVEFQPNDLILTLIERFRQKAKVFNKDFKFIFKAKQLIQNLTAEQAGINPNDNIFVI